MFIKRRPRQQAGLSLVELVMFIVIIGPGALRMIQTLFGGNVF